jgi:hypothetical protein
MTRISEYIDDLRRRGIDLEVKRLGTLWVLPELIDWDSRADVIRFLGLRKQVAHCLVYNEDRLIDWTRHDVELKRLKLAGPRIRKEDYELALGTLDGDAADASAYERDLRERSIKRQLAALTGDWK